MRLEGRREADLRLLRRGWDAIVGVVVVLNGI
jgi:hypothetical protein